MNNVENMLENSFIYIIVKKSLICYYNVNELTKERRMYYG